MTYLEQKNAIDAYSNYLKEGYVARISRILDDYMRLLGQLRESDAPGEVVNTLYNYSYRPLKEKLEHLCVKASRQNAEALDHITAMLDSLIKNANNGI